MIIYFEIYPDILSREHHLKDLNRRFKDEINITEYVGGKRDALFMNKLD